MANQKKKVTPVALPVRGGSKRGPLRSISEFILPYFPALRKKMILADMKKPPEKFMDQVLISSVFAAIALSILAFIFMDMAGIAMAAAFTAVLFLLFLIFGFFYFMMYPSVMVLKRRRAIDYELVFAVRHLLIGIRSGMPLFDAMVGVSRGYGEVSKEFNSIVEKITLGTPIAQAIREVVQKNPSPAFRRIMIQLANSVGSGADVAESLEIVLNQVFREQIIDMKAYGQKLNPLIMFYMIFGIIFPSLGMAFAIILFSFIGSGRFELNAPVLLLFLIMVGVIQFMFLSMVETSRPRYAF
ncbi:MAG: type II secretion system F family protein [Candidatus Micrarchaeia archaeon]